MLHDAQNNVQDNAGFEKERVNNSGSMGNESEDAVFNSPADIPSSMPDDVVETRYPSLVRRPLPEWCMNSAARYTDRNIEVATCGEPSLKKAMSATLEEAMRWKPAIDKEFDVFASKENMGAD